MLIVLHLLLLIIYNSVATSTKIFSILLICHYTLLVSTYCKHANNSPTLRLSPHWEMSQHTK